MVNLISLQTLNKNQNIKIIGLREHSKASERYIDVVFDYPDIKYKWAGSVPYEYRRTGINCRTEQEIIELLEKVYEYLNPRNYDGWIKTEKGFWDKYDKKITRSFFDGLVGFTWKCVFCQLPKNLNWARRFQDIKEFGYTTSTDTKMYCQNCKKNTTHLLLLPIPRGSPTGYETWSPELRDRILKVLNNFDVYENRTNMHLLPDHKFPEIRWDEKTREEKLNNNMSEKEIKHRFQLLNNQRNQQKREVCRTCYQTGKRGYPYGTKFYYHGDEDWPKNIPKQGKDAEKGCIGCGWYDLQKWREELAKKIR